MEIIDALNARFSARAYKPQPVSREILEKVMAAATRAPSWANTQPWEIYVAGGEPLERLRTAFVKRFEEGAPSSPDIARPAAWPPAIRERMAGYRAHRDAQTGAVTNEEIRRANTARNYRFFGAPVVIYLAMDRSLTAYSVFDVGMVAQSIMLVAKEYGLDTIPAVMLVAFPDLIRAEMGIPDEQELVLGLALGYADPEVATNKYRSLRRPLEDAVHFQGF